MALHPITLDDDRWSWSRATEHHVEAADASVRWTSVGGSDYWRLTASGVVLHSGHARTVPASGDFRIEAEFDADLVDRYDQVGLIVLKDLLEWFKCSYERDGDLFVGGVLTRDTSDWSRAPASVAAGLAVNRTGDLLEVFSRAHGGEWSMIRQCTIAGPVHIGPYSAAPIGAGFEAKAVLSCRVS